MENSTKIKEEIIKRELDSIDSFIMNLLDMTTHQFKNSSELLKNNIKDSTYQLIYDLVTDPLKSSYNVCINSEKKVYELIETIVKNSFLINKELILKTFKTNNKNNGLIYFIALNDDNVTNRGILYEFLNQYEETPLSKKFPICFNFVPSDFIKNIKNLSEDIEEIQLNESLRTSQA